MSTSIVEIIEDHQTATSIAPGFVGNTIDTALVTTLVFDVRWSNYTPGPSTSFKLLGTNDSGITPDVELMTAPGDSTASGAVVFSATGLPRYVAVKSVQSSLDIDIRVFGWIR